MTVKLSDIEEARAILRSIILATPMISDARLSREIGASSHLKAESLQMGGSFKIRGAFNKISRLTDEEKNRGVIAASAGNHAQGVALAAALNNIRSTIVLPEFAPLTKIIATKSFGGEVVLHGNTFDEAVSYSRELQKKHGYTYVHAFDDELVIAGQGTAGQELFEEVGPLDQLFVCTGGGGLISGCALAAAQLSPGCEVYGVEPAAGNDVQQAFRTGVPVTIPLPQTIADGAQTMRVGDLTFPIIRALVTDVLTATDAELVAAMKLFASRMKMIVEPTGCLAAAAVFNRAVPLKRRVGVIISGGNVDLAAFAKLTSV